MNNLNALDYANELTRRFGSSLLTREQCASELGRSEAALRQAEKKDLRDLKRAQVRIGRSVRYHTQLFAEFVLSHLAPAA